MSHVTCLEVSMFRDVSLAHKCLMGITFVFKFAFWVRIRDL